MIAQLFRGTLCSCLRLPTGHKSTKPPPPSPPNHELSSEQCIANTTSAQLDRRVRSWIRSTTAPALLLCPTYHHRSVLLITHCVSIFWTSSLSVRCPALILLTTTGHGRPSTHAFRTRLWRAHSGTSGCCSSTRIADMWWFKSRGSLLTTHPHTMWLLDQIDGRRERNRSTGNVL